jgi:Ca2+:H+ antiporter
MNDRTNLVMRSIAKHVAKLIPIVGPLLGLALLAVVWGRPQEWLLIALVSTALIGSVLIAVHHAEVVALKVGEPFGTLILALAVTAIESALIVSMMLSENSGSSVLARDTVFATVMIVCNGVVGLCLLVGGMRHHVIAFRAEGAIPPLSVLASLATLTLVVPALTTTTVGPSFSPSQLLFAGGMSLLLYGVFVFVQTVRHRDYFLPVDQDEASMEKEHIVAPSLSTALTSLGLLLVSLGAVVGLAKTLAPAIEAGVVRVQAPISVVGIAIALLVLLPETWSALRAASANRMQTSLNLALGSAIATIGLTIPVVTVVSIVFDLPLMLGLPPKEMVMLMLTFVVSVMTFASGRATVLQGAVHLVLFAAFLFLSVVP